MNNFTNAQGMMNLPILPANENYINESLKDKLESEPTLAFDLIHHQLK